ncbi:MAG TPA: single-stranded-DNA-specific exonuclease RecJ [Cytophagaceae bacterium]|jgi:single-stranded-DNA-specific exonuclease|nr:single-stranded-DNA-specific exonuclease RecJ [Cytophagaceae bacterium]
MEKRWIIKDSPDPEKVNELASKLTIDVLLASLLVQRGIETFEEARKFFRPSLDDLHDPFLMKDMDRAIARLEKAFQNNEKILIYGDYDVDGTTSVSLVYDFLSSFYTNLDYYIPDRYKEGYGISQQGIDWANENGFSLIISLDCGIKSLEKVLYAKSLGIEFIICDHHLPGEELPPAIAVLDAKRKDCLYPYKELCGCGVGFKLMQALSIQMGLDTAKLLQYLDLVAIAICSDIVPITGENRTLVFLGIQSINKSPRHGILALNDISGFKKIKDVSNIVFGLGPRINAAGRIAHAKTAVKLLISKTETEAIEFASGLNDKNSIRKDFDSTITEEAVSMIQKNELLRTTKSTVLYKEDWHKGVIGIVASRCIEKFYKPTIILTKSGDYAAGSARSVAGFDVYAAIEDCAELLEQYGGHMYAAGLTMKIENVEAFRDKFEQAVSSRILPNQLIPQIEIDKKIELNQLSYKFYRILKQMAPFGPQNMQPVFLCENLQDDGRAKLLKEQHLKLYLKQNNSTVYEAIGFSMPQHFERIKKGDKFNACFSVEENEFRGEKSLQLQLKDIKFKEE